MPDKHEGSYPEIRHRAQLPFQGKCVPLCLQMLGYDPKALGVEKGNVSNHDFEAALEKIGGKKVYDITQHKAYDRSSWRPPMDVFNELNLLKNPTTAVLVSIPIPIIRTYEDPGQPENNAYHVYLVVAEKGKLVVHDPNKLWRTNRSIRRFLWDLESHKVFTMHTVPFAPSGKAQ